MRISSHVWHPDYPHHNPGLVFNAQIYLNEEKLDHCVFADEQRGIAEVYDTDEKGRIIIIADDTKIKILIGDVKVKIDPIKDYGLCADCNSPIGRDEGPKDGWQLEDGRIVCNQCCINDTKRLIDKKIAAKKRRELSNGIY